MFGGGLKQKKILYIDCTNGISGDMFLGALIDAEVGIERFESIINKLRLEDYTLQFKHLIKNNIKGLDVSVNLGECKNKRYIRDILKLIEQSEMSRNVKKLSKKIFMEVAEAEALAHNIQISEVSFHEAGAVDSIVDIVGAAICIDIIAPDIIISSNICDGHGFIKCRCGMIPVPVPAVRAMLKDSQIPFTILEEVTTEMVTPTGMGIVKTIANEFNSMPTMEVISTGYGFGKRFTGKTSHLKVVIGKEIYYESKE